MSTTPSPGPEEARRVEELEKALDESRSRERSLHESLRYLQTIVCFSNDWEYWRQADGRFSFVSETVMNVTGYTPQEFYEQPSLMEQIIHPEDRKLWTDHRHKRLRGEGVTPLEFRIMTKTGEVRHIQHVCRVVIDAQGNVNGVRGSNRDVTDQVQTRKQLKDVLELLPVCACCKKIRDDKGYWNSVEEFMTQRTDAVISHGICPECSRKSLEQILRPRTSPSKKQRL